MPTRKKLRDKSPSCFLVFCFGVFFSRKGLPGLPRLILVCFKTVTQVTPMPSLRRVLKRGVTSWHMQVPLMSLLRAVLGVNR